MHLGTDPASEETGVPFRIASDFANGFCLLPRSVVHFGLPTDRELELTCSTFPSG
jgi:hypothetical protein